MEGGAAFSARRVRATRRRRFRSSRLGAKKHDTFASVARGLIDSESGKARSRWRGENKNRKPKTKRTLMTSTGHLSPSRRRVALTVTRESHRNAVIARSTRAPARFYDARNRARRRFRVVRVPPCHAGARASEPRESAASARARPRARAKKSAQKPEVSRARENRGNPRMARRAAYLAQGAEPLGVDRGLVHENLFRAVVGGDEPETLLGVEPLHLRASPARGSVRKRAIEATVFEESIGRC